MIEIGSRIVEFQELLQKKVKPDRFKHSQNVALEAKLLAERFGADVEKAELAGLLHDYARDISNKELLLLAGDFNLRITPAENAVPVLLHGPVGAKLVEQELGIDDESVLQAVAYHTTAAAGMDVLSKIIYLADIIEPSRNFTGIDKLRELAFKELNIAVLEALDSSLKYCLQKRSVIHPLSIEARNELLETLYC